MSKSFNNIDRKLLPDLNAEIIGADTADFCVGYFNLRGWRMLDHAVSTLKGSDNNSPTARILIGMSSNPDEMVRRKYSNSEYEIADKERAKQRKRLSISLAKQLTMGYPTLDDEYGLRRLAHQLREKRLAVRFFTRCPLHSKFYLVHRNKSVSCFVGSSNLTMGGFRRNIESNAGLNLITDDLENLLKQSENTTALEFAKDFTDLWDDEFCIDITEELLKILDNSWAGIHTMPYDIYMKTIYHLAKDSMNSAEGIGLPDEFADYLLPFQLQGVSLSLKILNDQSVVIISDVVGLGKTRVACAMVKTLQLRHGDNALIVCPPKLIKMWRSYINKFHLTADIISHAKVDELYEREDHFSVVVIDESHNFRNRGKKRFRALQSYVHKHRSKTIQLTATPYNKDFSDITNQLEIAIPANKDLGIRPNEQIHQLGGISEYHKQHKRSIPSSLDAFRNVNNDDDKKELMGLFLMRRTRAHIKRNYAVWDDEKQRYYLKIDDGKRFYFPNRVPRQMIFSKGANPDSDQYALLYSQNVIDFILDLELPRYGLARFLVEDAITKAKPNEKEHITSLEKRIGRKTNLVNLRLVNLFKRLESCGFSFIRSIQRQILRDCMFCYEHQNKREILVRGLDSDDTDEFLEEDSSILDDEIPRNATLADYEKAAEKLSKKYQKNKRHLTGKRHVRIRSSLLGKGIEQSLKRDAKKLLAILKVVPKWSAKKDRKLEALYDLCAKTHSNEKLLIFTEYSDTAVYLHSNLKKMGLSRVSLITGSTFGTETIVKRFSPVSNECDNIPSEKQTRVLVATEAISEGQNLQDAYIQVNFDLPWALISLIQRAGRVDRIGQTSPNVYCYNALPEEGIEEIIALRSRLIDRLANMENLIGSDESHFVNTAELSETLTSVYTNQIDLSEQVDEDDIDIRSRAYEIFTNAIKRDPTLEDRIQNMDNVVYSGMHCDDPHTVGGVIAYIRDASGIQSLVQLKRNKEILPISQYKILKNMECEPTTSRVEPAKYHHEYVAKAAEHVHQILTSDAKAGYSCPVARYLLDRLGHHLANNEQPLFKDGILEELLSMMETRRLSAKSKKQIRLDIKDSKVEHIDNLRNRVIQFFNNNDLFDESESDEPDIEFPEIICSMSLLPRE